MIVRGLVLKQREAPYAFKILPFCMQSRWTHVQLRIRGQGKAGQIDIVLVRSLNGDDGLVGSLDRQPLVRRRHSGDELELGLELADGP